jgi:hypothetical protein
MDVCDLPAAAEQSRSPIYFSQPALMAVFIALPWFLLGGLGYCAALVVRSIGRI